MSHFNMKCRECGKVLENVYCAFCEHCKDALLVTEYHDRLFSEKDAAGIWKYNWLPVHSNSFEQPGPVVYKSEELADELDLRNLYIAFNGYWPERGAFIQTCTFKEFEAAVVLQNAIDNGIEGLTVASAGNTARAFAHLSSISGFPVLIVVPRMCLSEMWYLESHMSIPTFVVGDGDYSNAIDMAKRIAMISGMPFEGGTKNIAKRDGLGIVMIEAVSEIGRLPDHYFQAVGSGAGAVGVFEMCERFLKDGRFGPKFPQMHLAQNSPFAPMVRAWQKASRSLFPEDLRPELIGEISTRVLSSRYPAYSVKGGVYDALVATDGKTYGIRNEDVFVAQNIFHAAEGIDIVPAAGVATAALMNAVTSGAVRKKDTILLNITGGGEKHFKDKNKAHLLSGPVFVSKNIADEELEKLLCDILKKN
ncbi:MAG: cysteate synthase [Nitrospirae bacterium]|nr:MAG: cysteate synthase [Nitrospirota bacterium]